VPNLRPHHEELGRLKNDIRSFQILVIKILSLLFMVLPVIYWSMAGELKPGWLVVVGLTFVLGRGASVVHNLVSDEEKIPTTDLRLARYTEDY